MTPIARFRSTAFCILDKERLVSEVLLQYFRHNNLASFLRQINS